MKVKINVHETESSLKALAGFLIFVIVFGLFGIFYLNQEEIVANNYKQFMLLAITASGFLLGLLYLINKPLSKARRTKKRK